MVLESCDFLTWLLVVILKSVTTTCLFVCSFVLLQWVNNFCVCYGRLSHSIAEEIKSRLRSGNACYHSVQNLLSSSLLSKNLKIKMYRTIILPVVLYGCETWSLTLREERKLRVFENMVLRRIFGPRRDEVTGDWRRLHNDITNR